MWPTIDADHDPADGGEYADQRELVAGVFDLRSVSEFVSAIVGK